MPKGLNIKPNALENLETTKSNEQQSLKMNVNEYGEIFESTESFINTKRESQDESSDNLQKQKSLGLNRNVSMILDIIDRKNKIVNISENLLDDSDGSDSLKSES